MVAFAAAFVADLFDMNNEPTTEPIVDDDNHPATKSDLKHLRTEVDGIDHRLIKIEVWPSPTRERGRSDPNYCPEYRSANPKHSGAA